MKLHFSRKNWVPQLIIIFIIANGLFSKYIEHTTLWNWASLVLLILAVSSKHKRIITLKNNADMILSFVAVLILLIIGIFFSESNEFIFANLITVTYPAVICLLALFVSENNFSIAYLDSLFKFLNVVWLINLIVLFLQIQGTGFLIKRSWLEINSFYQDHWCGLFGNSGTHELSMFSIFMLVYNLYYSAYKLDNYKKKRRLVIYTIITEAVMLVFSAYNENIALFALLPGFALLYYLLKIEWTSRNISQWIVQYGKYILLVIIIIGLVFAIPTIRKYIMESIINRLNKVLVFETLQTNGSNERFAIPLYALKNGWGWRLGKGFGAWGLHLGGYMGFGHFGLNSISSFITLGGIWFYIAYSSFYASVLKALCGVRKNGSKLWIAGMIAVVVLTSYTILFSSVVCSVWFTMTFLIFGQMYKKICAEKQGISLN